MTTPVIGITGWKNSGKTTLVARLVEEFSRRGLTVNTVKHAHHHFDIDHEGTDSFRHREAGASEVAIVSGSRWALMHELQGDAEPSLDDVIARMSPADLVIIEGYKREAHLKIEVRRKDTIKGEALTAGDPNIIAIAADHEIGDEKVPVFDLDNIAAIADFIEERVGLERRQSHAS